MKRDKYMRTAFLVITVLSALALKVQAQEQNTNLVAEAKEYRTIDVRKTGDGFTTTLGHTGELGWTTNGWLVCDVASLIVVGTAPQIDGVKMVIAEQVRCVDGQIATKDYGVIRARSFINSRGNRVPQMLMTPETIAKIKRALESKAKASAEKK
jgi:hypothetical protein